MFFDRVGVIYAGFSIRSDFTIKEWGRPQISMSGGSAEGYTGVPSIPKKHW